MNVSDTSTNSVHKCADCSYAISVTGKCGFHDLPLIEAENLDCEGRVADFADGTSRPRNKPFGRKKSTAMETFLFGFLTACGGILFLMAIFLFFFSDDESWQGIWGLIGFVFLGGLGLLCFHGSVKHLKEVYAERKNAAARKD